VKHPAHEPESAQWFKRVLKISFTITRQLVVTSTTTADLHSLQSLPFFLHEKRTTESVKKATKYFIQANIIKTVLCGGYAVSFQLSTSNKSL